MTIDFSTLTFDVGPYKIEWDYIGEGNSGYYDPTDPTDEPLLRATVFVNGEDVGSYCTLATVATDAEELKVASQELALAMGDDFSDHIMQRWTWRDYPAA